MQDLGKQELLPIPLPHSAEELNAEFSHISQWKINVISVYASWEKEETSTWTFHPL